MNRIFLRRTFFLPRHRSPLFWPKIGVFVITFTSFGLYHASRKNLSGVKASVANDWLNGTTYHGVNATTPLFTNISDANKFLGLLDALFMSFYAAALFFWGYLGDVMNPRNVVAFGMITSAISLGLFSLVPYYLNFYDIPWYIVMWAFFGVAQACGWPNNVAIMGNWFGKDRNNKNSSTGFILGIWSANQSVGNIFGSIMVSIIIKFGYMYTFICNVVLLLFGALLVQYGIQPSPKDYQNLDEEPEIESQLDVTQSLPSINSSVNVRVRSGSRHSSPSISSQDQISASETKQRISLWKALFLPGVLPYCLCNACLKLVNYAFFFWLPFYLNHNYGWNESIANRLSVWYDIGGIFGSILGGLLTDKMGFRTPIIMVMLLMSILCLIVFANLGASYVLNMIGLFLLGSTISGPYNLIVGTISVDLGTQKALKGNKDAMSTVSGLIDGTGSAGSAIGQLLVPLVQEKFGWNRVFYMFVISNIFAIICLLQRFMDEMRKILNKSTSRRRRGHRRTSSNDNVGDGSATQPNETELPNEIDCLLS
uniref:MFS domain-containing protein n=1 Tax=Parastrongyloides trichosuri TaxID=131310 RepID=A0A0N4Z6V0_PARTI